MGRLGAPKVQESAPVLGAEGPVSSPRNTNAKSSAKSGNFQGEKSAESQAHRGLRYNLQDYIQRQYLGSSDFDQTAPDWNLYNSLPRVVKCKRTRVSLSVGVDMSPADRRAYYTGLHTCGSVWTCPVCCHGIMETRRREIAQLFDWAYGTAPGKKVIMITFTIPHYSHQSCRYVLDGIASSFKTLRQSRAYVNFLKSLGYEGAVRALEVTYTAQGWHVHTHELFVVDDDADSDSIRQFLTQRWEIACSKHGRIPRGRLRKFRELAVSVKDNISSSDYLAKADDSDRLHWGGDRELTGLHLKNLGQSCDKKGLTPFQLAHAAAEGLTGAWDAFTEYADAFKGRSAVFWSHGLKSRVGVDSVSDEDAAADPGDLLDEIVSIASFSLDEWRYIRENGYRSHVLDLAENAGSPGIRAWLKSQSVPDYSAPLIDESVFSDFEIMRVLTSSNRF